MIDRKPIQTFEYGEFQPISNRKNLEKYLQNLWLDYKQIWDNYETPDQRNDLDTDQYQPFLSFDGNKAKANNYVGFIHYQDTKFEIFPKIFKDFENTYKSKMVKHIFFWLDYCRKLKFPFNKSTLDSIETESIPELIIHLISTHILETISEDPLTMYHERDKALQSPRGKILFGDYINNGLSKGRYHEVDCRYEPFIYDNVVNRTIKYCCKVLLDKTRIVENQDVLQNILFMLDEVDDVIVTPHEIENIRLTPIFSDYNEILYHCRQIIEQLIYSTRERELEQWSLLFPMEYIFEDFVAGFLEDNFSDEWDVKYQDSSKYVTFQPKVFRMQHDIVLTQRNNSGKKVIIDTKYKRRNKDFKSDKKKGISQSDLYQMLSYGYRQGCTEILLLYPNITEDLKKPDYFKIKSGFNEGKIINVTACEIPFWSLKGLDNLRDILYKSLEEILFQYKYN